ncbi:MAG: hypothetical protein ABI891_16050 [Acidobacteriota bacterium]
MKKYPADLTDSQWNHIKVLFAVPMKLPKTQKSFLDFFQFSAKKIVSCQNRVAFGQEGEVCLDKHHTTSREFLFVGLFC